MLRVKIIRLIIIGLLIVIFWIFDFLNTLIIWYIFLLLPEQPKKP